VCRGLGRRSLGFIGAKSTNVVEALVEARKDENTAVRCAVAQSSRTAVGPPQDRVPALIEMLTVKKGVTGKPMFVTRRPRAWAPFFAHSEFQGGQRKAAIAALETAAKGKMRTWPRRRRRLSRR